MTKANFKISLIALAISLVMVSCGGGNKQQKQIDDLDKATEKMIEEANKDGGLSKEGKEKLASLGKTVKGKRIVALEEYNNAYDVYVIEIENGNSYLEGYCFYFDTERGRDGYARYVKSNERTIKEKSDKGLWVYPTRIGQGERSWQEVYDEYSKDGWKIIE